MAQNIMVVELVGAVLLWPRWLIGEVLVVELPKVDHGVVPPCVVQLLPSPHCVCLPKVVVSPGAPFEVICFLSGPQLGVSWVKVYYLTIIWVGCDAVIGGLVGGVWDQVWV
jgi:hypothetical protein